MWDSVRLGRVLIPRRPRGWACFFRLSARPTGMQSIVLVAGVSGGQLIARGEVIRRWSIGSQNGRGAHISFQCRLPSGT